MKKRISISIVVVVVLVVILMLLAPWKANAPENGGKENGANKTLIGKIVCLPKPGDGPHTMECALGMQASDGAYYALKNNPLGELPVNQQIRVTGKVTPPANDEIYDIAGTIDVDSIEKTGE